MFEFEVKRCTRRCAKTERELKPGEVIHSVLVAEGAELARYDYCNEAWEAPPENAIAVWKSQIPAANANKVNWAPNDVMLDLFTRIEGDGNQLDTRFVLALLLLRRRIVRQEGTDRDAAGREVMVVSCPRDESEHRVTVVSPTADRIGQIQQQLAELLTGGN